MILVGCSESKTDDFGWLKKVVQEMIDATLSGDYANVIDLTYPETVKLLGGRDELIKTTQTAMKQFADRGFKLQSFTAGDPGEFFTEDAKAFVIIPTKGEMIFPQGKRINESYLLGISSDGGRMWTFIDGTGIESRNDKGLPKLPEKLKLPEKKPPKIIED